MKLETQDNLDRLLAQGRWVVLLSVTLAVLFLSAYTGSMRENRHMILHTPDDMFATAAVCALNPVTGELRLACAGHEPVLLVRAAAGEAKARPRRNEKGREAWPTSRPRGL